MTLNEVNKIRRIFMKKSTLLIEFACVAVVALAVSTLACTSARTLSVSVEKADNVNVQYSDSTSSYYPTL